MTFAFLLIGSMLPYWFSALTMKSVGDAAMEMVHEVEHQFKMNPELLNEGTAFRSVCSVHVALTVLLCYHLLQVPRPVPTTNAASTSRPARRCVR